MMSNIFSRTLYKYVPCLRHSIQFIFSYLRIKIRGYKIKRAYGTVNSSGIILQSIIDKILYPLQAGIQPFFTTKPTGSRTGLGLSLSYDIIKAHGGEIKVETSGEEGTQFIILLNRNVL